jgi:hypothetical protein
MASSEKPALMDANKALARKLRLTPKNFDLANLILKDGSWLKAGECVRRDARSTPNKRSPG